MCIPYILSDEVALIPVFHHWHIPTAHVSPFHEVFQQMPILTNQQQKSPFMCHSVTIGTALLLKAGLEMYVAYKTLLLHVKLVIK